MIKIGVTGGIGSGKTTICKWFEKNAEIPVYYADDRAKWILENNNKCKYQIIKLFGSQSFLSSGKLNRTYLAKKVFNKENSVDSINKIVHPLVSEDFQDWIKEHAHSKIIFKESALLFETGGYKLLDKIIVVDASEEVRMKRVLERDKHRTEQQIKNIIAKQMPQEEKNKKADFIINNNNGLDSKPLSELLIQLKLMI